MSQQPGAVPYTHVANPKNKRRGYMSHEQAVLVAQLVVETAWTAPTLSTNWSVFGGLTAGYKLDTTGRVYLRGVITKSLAVVSGETVFTLPAGFRPVQNTNFPAVSNSAFGYLSVSSAGVVAVQVGNAAWFSLDGISFEAA
jgi:hypothetical protein